MNQRILFLFTLLTAATLRAAPVKVAVIADSDVLRDAVAKSGADVVGLENADVVVLQSTVFKPRADRAELEAFAKRGGGIVAVGGAIAAGDWMKPLVGGAWTENSRKFSNRMMLYVVTDAHAITRNASPFDVDDETPYDLDTDAAINVLASAFTPKVTAKKIDPRSPMRLDRANIYDIQQQMWTYEGADQHRAFVLLQGQPETLKHASIRTFILRGIAWAAKRDNVDELCAKQDVATLRYPKDGPRLAADTIRQFEMQPGFKASVVASEPLISKPIAMQWDARGRLWVAETVEYPNGRRPLTTESWKETGVLKPGNYERPAYDRISILEDMNGDGEMDKKTVFYEGLELVTGFCLYGDGAIVIAEPDLVFLHDTNGDDQCDKVDRLLTGHRPGDTHFVENHLIVGMDGWIYANTGGGAADQSIADRKNLAHIRSGVLRFKPDGSKIEQVGSKGGNGFGLDLTSDGELFFGQATSGSPVQHVVLPEAILARGKIGGAGSCESVVRGRKVIRPDMPTRAALMQIDQVGGYSAACASAVYEGGSWPATWERTVFCTEPILDIIHCEKLMADGVTFVGEMQPPDREWLRSQDYWFFPVDIQFGPDGAMYVLDFYCPVVAHSDSRGPQHTKSGASVRPDRDHYFGRIYKIQNDQARKLDVPDLSKATDDELLSALLHPNKWVRSTAQELFIEHDGRQDRSGPIRRLAAMAKEEKFALARILALWTALRVGDLSPEMLALALKSDDAAVRKNALLICEAWGPQCKTDVTALLNDADPRVRLTALRAMSSTELTPAGAAALLAIMPELKDDWSKSAASAAASSNPGPVIEAALAKDAGTDDSSLVDLVSSLAQGLAEKGDAGAMTRVVIAASKSGNTALVRAVLEAAAINIPEFIGQIPGLAPALATLLASKDVPVAFAALPFAVAWDKRESSKVAIAGRIGESVTIIGNDRVPDAVRAAVVLGLVRSRSADPRILPLVGELLRAKVSDGLMLDVIAALSMTGDTSIGKILTSALPTLSAIPQNAAFEALAGRAEWAGVLLAALEAKQVQSSLLGPARWSKLRQHPDAAIAKRTVAVMDAVGGGTNPQKNEIIAKLQPEIESEPGDPVKGKALFSGVCSICHKFNGEGKEVGPVLDGIGVHGVSELLIHILDPSRAVDNEHRTWSIALKNGTFATGIVIRENERAVTLRMAGGVDQDIRLADIKSRQDTGLSLMPEGFESLGADSLRDILAYLSAGSSKYHAVNLGRSFTTDTRGGLYADRDAKNDTVQPVKYGVAMVEGVPFSLPDPTTTASGGNVIVLKPGDGGSYAATLPGRVEIPVGYAAGNLHFLGGVAGWGGGPDSHKKGMKVTIKFADGKKQVEELDCGDVFIDYVSGDDVPGSKRVDGLTTHAHVRYFSLPVKERAPIEKLVLESYKNGIAPTTLAITTDNEAPAPRRKYAAFDDDDSNFKPQFTDAVPQPPQHRPANGPRVLLVGGGSSHDFVKFFGASDKETLTGTAGWVDFTQNLNGIPAILDRVDVLVMSANQPIAKATSDALIAFANAGKGFICLHPGTWYAWKNFQQWNKEIVGGGTRGHDKLGEFDVTVTAKHPVTEGVSATFKITDELYNYIPDPAATPIEVLATAMSPSKKVAFPQVFVVKHPKARIVGITLGHDARAHDLPEYQLLLKNTVKWVDGK